MLYGIGKKVLMGYLRSPKGLTLIRKKQMRKVHKNQRVSDSNIRNAARKSTSISQLASVAGYNNCRGSAVGSGTLHRIENVIGWTCYNEISSGLRRNMKKSYWTRPNRNN